MKAIYYFNPYMFIVTFGSFFALNVKAVYYFNPYIFEQKPDDLVTQNQMGVGMTIASSLNLFQ